MDSTPPSPIVDCRLTFENVKNWKYDQVAYWLQENNFREYQKVFSGKKEIFVFFFYYNS
jgi:mitogen-activated protein kinase kinase kinase